ncbi:MAG: hypothetical protein JWO53_113, partial [Chlamydiia bacterium]|nr:hypothetical protein [Chlamydiia bacterium]
CEYFQRVYEDAWFDWIYHECIFARKPPCEKGSFGKEPFFLKEHSLFNHPDSNLLLLDRKQNQLLATYRSPTCKGFGKLIDFQEPIGTYLNPTTQEKSSTTKGLVYLGKRKTVIIPAAPDHSWFEKLHEQFTEKGWQLPFSTPIKREVYRALIGRVIPQLIDVTIHVEKEPYVLELLLQGMLSDEDQETLELVWFETLAGLPPETKLEFLFTYEAPSNSTHQ